MELGSRCFSSVKGLKAQVLQELAYHRQETVRLQKILDLLEGGQGSVHPASKDGSVVTARDVGVSIPIGTVVGKDPVTGKELTVAKRRTHTAEARRKIGEAVRQRHERARLAKLQNSEIPASGNPSGNPSGTLSQEIK